MNKDQIKGAAKDAAGKVEKAFGDAVKSPEHQIKGVANQVAGKTQKAVGDMKDQADKAGHEARNEARHEAKKEMKRDERKM